MADVIYNPVAGVPFSGGTRMVDCGDGTYAPVGLGISGFLPVLSLNGVSATGPGAVLSNAGVRNNHSLVVTTSAGVSAGVVALEGSQDNVNWVFAPLSTVTANAANRTFLGTAATLTPFRYLRANITTVITGGTVIAYIASA